MFRAEKRCTEKVFRDARKLTKLSEGLLRPANAGTNIFRSELMKISRDIGDTIRIASNPELGSRTSCEPSIPISPRKIIQGQGTGWIQSVHESQGRRRLVLQRTIILNRGIICSFCGWLIWGIDSLLTRMQREIAEFKNWLDWKLRCLNLIRYFVWRKFVTTVRLYLLRILVLFIYTRIKYTLLYQYEWNERRLL